MQYLLTYYDCYCTFNQTLSLRSEEAYPSAYPRLDTTERKTMRLRVPHPSVAVVCAVLAVVLTCLGLTMPTKSSAASSVPATTVKAAAPSQEPNVFVQLDVTIVKGKPKLTASATDMPDNRACNKGVTSPCVRITVHKTKRGVYYATVTPRSGVALKSTYSFWGYIAGQASAFDQYRGARLYLRQRLMRPDRTLFTGRLTAVLQYFDPTLPSATPDSTSRMAAAVQNFKAKF